MADLLSASAQQHVDIVEDVDDHGKILGLSQEQVAILQEQAITWAAAHGLLVRYNTPQVNQKNSAVFTHIPFCLLPIPFSAQEFQKAIELSPLYGRLVDRVSRDLPWLHSILDGVVSEDAFTAKLLDLSRIVEAEGINQKAYLGIHRSDYMVHDPEHEGEERRLLQVELNTIASSFGCLSSLTCDLHHYLISRIGPEMPEITLHYGLDPIKQKEDLVTRLPKNEAIHKLPEALAIAHQHYGVQDAIIVFIVQPNETNTIDQRWLEYQLWEKYHIKVVRKSLFEIHEQAFLVENIQKRPQALVLDQKKEVAVVYFRGGYTPKDYPSEIEWKARLKIERSFSIKCPSIAYQLAGTKKIQQVLSIPQQLERFITKEEKKNFFLLQKSFARLFGLEKNLQETIKIKEMAMKQPNAFVLKPQREGGGNNLYGKQISFAMKNKTPKELESYILMERIFPKEKPAILLRQNQLSSGKTISELGMYITCLFDAQGKEILNQHAGHLLRTKLSTTDEGGVATGFSVLSSPLLL